MEGASKIWEERIVDEDEEVATLRAPHLYPSSDVAQTKVVSPADDKKTLARTDHHVDLPNSHARTMKQVHSTERPCDPR